MRVIGLDLSLTATGIASISDASGHIEVETQVIKTKADDGTIADRYHRLEKISASVVTYAYGADLLVIESPSYSSGGRGTWDRAGLWWRVITTLLYSGIPVTEVSPKSRAKFATNNGNAGKGAIAVAMGRLWPDVELVDDNAADALVLATMAAQRLHMAVPQKSWHPKELAKIGWSV